MNTSSKNGIRVGYSGYIIFASQILSVFTGLVFTLLLTRNMTNNEFGAWSFVFTLIGVFTLISTLFPFWATRFVARGKNDAIKTAVSANFFVAAVAAIIYLALVSVILGALHVSSIAPVIYLIAALQIINAYLISALEGCLRAVKPEATGYGLLIEEVVKVVLAFTIFLGLGQLFLGAIAGIVVGASFQAIYYGWLLRDYFRQPLHWGYLREWLKGSAAFIYNAVGSQLVSFVLILLVLFGGETAVADYQAAITFSTVIGYAASLAFALYPKMLAQECPTDVALSLKNMLMLALPMATVALTMSTSLLTILNASYSGASPVLILLTVDALVVLVSQFYTQCLMGVETLDAEGKISLRLLVRSKIFKVFTLPYVQAAIALPADYYILTQVPMTGPVGAATSVVAVNIFVHAATFIAIYAWMRREFKLIIVWKSIAKYILTSVAAGALMLVLPSTTTLTMTFAKALAGVGLYAGLLLTIDADARKLGKQIIAEIRGVFRR